jgi:hypothetical protein
MRALIGIRSRGVNWRVRRRLCYRRDVPGRKRKTTRRTRRSNPIRTAAARAVDRVLSSDESFELLIRRLEAAGWHIERPSATAARTLAGDSALTPPARAR